MIVVDTPASDRNLVSLAEAKAELGVTDDTQDTRITVLITRVSQAIERITGVVYVLETVTETRQGSGTRFLTLARRFVTELLEVTYRGTEQTLADFLIEDGDIGQIYHESGFTLAEAAMGLSRDPIAGTGRPDWVIQYKAGHANPASVPEVFKMGCLEVLKVMFFGGGTKYAQSPAIKSARLADASFTMQDTGQEGAGSASIMNKMISELFAMEFV